MSIEVPILRFGRVYESLDRTEVQDCRSGEVLAAVHQANAGVVRRDLRKAGAAAAALEAIPASERIELCRKAGELFMTAELPMGLEATQTPEQYVETLSRTSGLPHVMCRRNMDKINTVLTGMGEILNGLTRGLDLAVLDSGIGVQAGSPVSFVRQTGALGVVLPSNSPGVNSIWLPALALATPVVLKPGRDEPWTPMRLVQAFIAAGFPAEAFGFYPTDHEGANHIMTGCDRAIIFGDDKTIDRYRNNLAIEVHGTGRSKVILGDDAAEHWGDYVDVIVSSIVDNGGRSCINASCIITPRYGDELAEAVAERLAAITPTGADDPQARLSAFANPKFAEAISGMVDQGMETPGATDLTAAHRGEERLVEYEGAKYLLPTLVRCGRFDHPLANTEFMFPFASVVEMSNDDVFERIGPTLVATVISADDAFVGRAMRCRSIDRLNLGALPTSRVEWDQPHEGNLFEFLYHRRAIQRANVAAAEVV